jgi:hypothetical protein
MKPLSAVVLLAATSLNTGCSACGPEQHAITTGSSGLSMGGGVANRTIQYVTYHLTEPPASHNDFHFLFDALEGSTNGEGVAFTLRGQDAITQEYVWSVLALPVSLRQGDVYSVGSTFSIDVGSPAQAGFWGAHDLAQPTKADVAFVVSTYSSPGYTPTFTAVASTGTIRVVDRSPGQVQLDLDLSFTDANGGVRTLTGPAQASAEKSAALCN